MAEELNDEQWRTVDEHILLGRVLNAIKEIRQATGVGIPGATVICKDRYAHLRKTRPDDFALPAEEYWKGYYS